MSITGKDYETVLALNFVSSFAANDYLELVMSSADLNFSIHAESGLRHFFNKWSKSKSTIHCDWHYR